MLGDVQTHLSDGAVINDEEASEMGLKVRFLDPSDPLCDAIWRLHCECVLAIQC